MSSSSMIQSKVKFSKEPNRIFSLQEDDNQEGYNFCSKLKEKFLESILISPKNRYSLPFFRSETAVRREKKRQQQKRFKYIIHPFSMFKARYDIYLFCLYYIAIWLKSAQAAFFDKNAYENANSAVYFSVLIDSLCFADIVINFFSGYVIRADRSIELDQKNIAYHYVFSPYFVCDVLSSIPKDLLYQTTSIGDYKTLSCIIDMCCMLKIVRIFSVFRISYKILVYKKIKLSTTLTVLRATLFIFTIVHYAACILFMVPRIIRNKTVTDSILTTYSRYIFKSSAYILSVRLEKIEPQFPEEYILAIAFYIIGKMVVATTWIILVSVINDSKSAALHHSAEINQVEEYLRQKEVPPELCKKIEQFYRFKFQKILFKESNIEKLLSPHLKQEISLVLNQSLLSTIPLLSLLTSEEFVNIQSHFKHDILTPHTVVFHSGDDAHELYFLASGTVAIYTHSGMELYHLQDGAYFGEISLLMRNKRQVTAIAVEFCEVIKLHRRKFEKYLMKNKQIANHLKYWANLKFQDVVEIEKKYKLRYT